MKTIKCWAVGTISFCIISLLTLTVSTQYSDYSYRASTLNSLELLQPLKTEVELTLSRQRSIAELRAISSIFKKLQTDPEYLYLTILDDAKIVAKIAKSDELIILMPRLIGHSSYEWACMGGSNKNNNLPTACRVILPVEK